MLRMTARKAKLSRRLRAELVLMARLVRLHKGVLHTHRWWI